MDKVLGFRISVEGQLMTKVPGSRALAKALVGKSRRVHCQIMNKVPGSRVRVEGQLMNKVLGYRERAKAIGVIVEGFMVSY